jgi:DNA-binding MarR family transcriptional regulator
MSTNARAATATKQSVPGAGAANEPDEPDASEALDRLDDLDRMLVVWAREIPALDPLTEGIAERIECLAHDFEASLAETLRSFDLDRRWYHLLGKLRATGTPYRQSPGQLAASLRLSSGAITNRLDRMEEAGLIRRLPDPDDRRGVLVEPTELGHAAWDRTVAVQAQREALLASVLEPADREQLHRLLRQLMRAFPPSDKHLIPDRTQD